MTTTEHARARAVIQDADALIVAAGAGMGVDSGLPDFRGDEGFWQAYPPFAKLGLRFVELANPRWFERDPALAWGFYGHRMHLYRDTIPHRGFEALRRRVAALDGRGFVFTSNVDGQFHKAGFEDEHIVECHGSIHHLQCIDPRCASGIWDARGVAVHVDAATMRAAEPLPRCPACGRLARPNVLMFGDWGWRSERSATQEERLTGWFDALGDRRVVVIELGAGSAVPTVRHFSEQLARRRDVTLVRINPRESHGPAGTVSIAQGAAAAIDLLL